MVNGFEHRSHLHGLPEGSNDLHVHPQSRRVGPVQVLLQPFVEVFGGVPVAEADHQPVRVGGQREDRVALDHDAFDFSFSDGRLQLAEMSVSAAFSRTHVLHLHRSLTHHFVPAATRTVVA